MSRQAQVGLFGVLLLGAVVVAEAEVGAAAHSVTSAPAHPAPAHPAAAAAHRDSAAGRGRRSVGTPVAPGPHAATAGRVHAPRPPSAPRRSPPASPAAPLGIGTLLKRSDAPKVSARTGTRVPTIPERLHAAALGTPVRAPGRGVGTLGGPAHADGVRRKP